MFEFWPEHRDLSWHLLRPLAEAIDGGGECQEILRVAGRIRPRDAESWYAAWQAVAAAVEQLGGESVQAGHHITARGHYLRASNYYRWTEFFCDPEDARRGPAYDGCVRCFHAAGRYFVPPLQRVEIPYLSGSLPGYFYPGRNTPERPGPAVLYVAGADVLKEELYFLGGRAALDRGFSLLVMDGPGQGETLRRRGVPTRPDYEVPVAAAVDFLQARPEVDPDRIVLLGRSMGGYYAARAAAFEPRFRACAIFGALYDAADLFDRYPPIRRQLRWITGADTPEAARRTLETFTLEGVAERITCPVLIVHGEDDHLVPAWHATRLFEELRSPKELVLCPPGEPGSVHCGYDGFPYLIPRLVDWLGDHAAGRTAGG